MSFKRETTQDLFLSPWKKQVSAPGLCAQPGANRRKKLSEVGSKQLINVLFDFLKRGVCV